MTVAAPRITDAVRVRVPLVRPFVTSSGTITERDAWIVRLEAPDGRVGHGEAGLDPGADAAARDRLAAAIRAAVDRGTFDPERASTDPADAAVSAGLEGAALDLGLVDLGSGPTASVAVNATIGGGSAEATVAAARAAVAAGFRCLKCKVGDEGSTAELVDRMKALRAAVGPTVVVRLDANGAWDAATARHRLEGLAGLGVAYVEDPLVDTDPTALAALRHATDVPIAADAAVSTLAEADALLAADAVDVLVVKPARVGGPSAAVSIARAALAAGVGVTVSTYLETGFGLAAAARIAAVLPDRGHAHGLATADLLRDDLLADPWRPVDGRVRVPRGPLAVDPAAIDRWAVDRVGATW